MIKILIENMLELCKGERLYTSEYSSVLFPEKSVVVCESFENTENGYIFTENFITDEDKIQEIIVYGPFLQNLSRCKYSS